MIIDQARIVALLMRHHSQLYGFLYACLGNHADVEDVLQEVSVITLQKCEHLDSEQGFSAWVREIARREALNFQKRKARRPALVDPDMVNVLATAFEGIQTSTDWDARHEALTTCLDALPERSRALIRMRYSDPTRNVDALSEVVGRTASATYSLLKRIRESLRKCVEKKIAGAA